MTQIVTTLDAARILNIQPSSIRRLIRQGQLEFLRPRKIGRDWLVLEPRKGDLTKAKILRLLEKREGEI